MPLGLFLALARGLVLPGFRGGKAQIRHRPAVLGATNFRIGAQIADQDHLVDASRHDASPFVPDITKSSIANLVPHRPAARAIGARWPLSTRHRAANGPKL